jgi:diguanylate cyclase
VSGACLAVTKAVFDLSRSQGIAVLGLLERAKVPPSPAFYRLLFDYIAGVKGLMAGRIDEILTDGNGQVQNRLYDEFVAPYENREATDRTLEQMVSRLATLDRLIVESAEATATHSRSLAEAGGHFGAASLEPELLREWVMRLELNNQVMRQANSALVEELAEAHRELAATQAEIGRSRESALRDPLTGIANRAGLDLALTRLIAGLSGQPLCVAVLDIDHFKSLNDGYGHQAGDQVLLVVTRALLASARASDIVGRPGGDEFVVVLAGTTLQVAHNVADGIRAAIASSDLTGALGSDSLGGITASIGIAEFIPGESIARLFDRADRCLYRAKQGGRNRVDSFGEADAA